jgi:DNA polymerase III epsilon subunit-like protein
MMGASGSSYTVAQLVAHNADFDASFVQAWYERLGVYLPARRQVLCTLQRSMWFFSEEVCQRPNDFKLATLCHYFDVPFHAASAHEALADVVATTGLYRALTNRTMNLSITTAAAKS